ncbi:MAG: universal stress protein [Rubrobacteraceae bacterium]|nr:universal stress protein [Rubrobacteraceae bacterium]
MPGRIVLATDGSRQASLAARAATDVARHSGAQLHVIHAWKPVPVAHFKALVRDEMEREAREILEGQLAEIERLGGRVAGSHLKMEAPVDAILDLAGELGAGLVVMGSRGMGAVGRLTLGSVSEGVVYDASIPVLVVRGGEEAWPPRRLVVGDDGSEAARQAGELAASICSPFGASGLLLRAYPEPPGGEEPARVLREEMRRGAAELDRRAAEMERLLGGRPEIRVVSADPTQAILDAAEEGGRSALVAMGHRGLGVVRRVMVGSVSAKVLKTFEGPVLIHPQPER